MGLQTALYQQHTLLVQSGCAHAWVTFNHQRKPADDMLLTCVQVRSLALWKKFSITKIRALIASVYINATYTLKALQLDYLFDFFMCVDRTSEPADSQEE